MAYYEYFRTDSGVLYCGDYREILPNLNTPINLILTDPPYEIHAESGGGLHNNRDWLRNIHRDGMDTFDIPEFMKYIQTVNNHWYIFMSKNQLLPYLDAVKEYNWELLVMSKRNPIPTKHNKYLSDKEYCLFVRNGKCYFNNESSYKDYFTVKNVNVTPNIFHPAEKPISFVEPMIRISTRVGDTVLDPFVGSGTTAVVCAMYDRKWIAIEQSEKYCEIAKRRIQKVSGIAKLSSSSLFVEDDI